LTSFDLMKQKNNLSIIRVIKNEPGICRSEVARRTRLASQTVTNLVKEMGKHKLIIERNLQNNSKGRNPVGLYLNYGNFYVISVEMKLNVVNLWLSSLDNKVFREDSFLPSLNLVSELKTRIEEFLNLSLQISKRIMGIIISVEGVVEEKNGTVFNFETFKVSVPDLKEKLALLKTPFFIRNDVNLFAYCTNLKKKSSGNSIVIKLDSEIGSSLIIENQVFPSSSYLGEIGYMKIHNPKEIRNSKSHGSNCLVFYLGKDALCRDYGKDYENLVQDVKDMRIEAVKVIENSLEGFAPILANICIFLRLEEVVLYGKVANDFRSIIFRYLYSKLVDNMSYRTPFKTLEILEKQPIYMLGTNFFVNYILDHYDEYLLQRKQFLK